MLWSGACSKSWSIEKKTCCCLGLAFLVYPSVLKHSLPENPPFMDGFSQPETSIYMEFRSQPCLKTPNGRGLWHEWKHLGAPCFCWARDPKAPKPRGATSGISAALSSGHQEDFGQWRTQSFGAVGDKKKQKHVWLPWIAKLFFDFLDLIGNPGFSWSVIHRQHVVDLSIKQNI